MGGMKRTKEKQLKQGLTVDLGLEEISPESYSYNQSTRLLISHYFSNTAVIKFLPKTKAIQPNTKGGGSQSEGRTFSKSSFQH